MSTSARTIARAVHFLGIAGLTVASFLVPDANLFQRPELARMIFFHLPCALSATFFILAAGYFSIRYLTSKAAHWDVRSGAANEMAMVLSLLTMVTGILFSRAQWGEWWNWDPRQTSFLLVLLILGAYFVLRSGLGDRAKIANAYTAASLLPQLFLIFVFPRISQFSLHPSNTIVSGGFDANYRTVLYGLFILILIFCLSAYRQRVRVGLLEITLELQNGLENHRGDTTPSGMVRPVSLPPQG